MQYRPALGLAMTTEQMRIKWSDRRAEFNRFRTLVSGVAICEEVLADIAAFSEAIADEHLSLAHAALLSGWSKRTLERWIRQGKIENVGQPGRPAVLRREVPRKPGAPIEFQARSAYDVNADAQTLARQLTGGHHGSQAAA
jgi:hypothetical protein